MKVLVLLCCFLLEICSSISCIDRNSNFVDWFVVYKPPKLSLHADPHIKRGEGLFYADSNDPRWTLLTEGIHSLDQPISYTMNQFYSTRANPNVFSLFYSDQPPHGRVAPASRGHAKGVLNYDANGGFWLVHSVPGFPDSSAYSYPRTGHRYGQMFLCISTHRNKLRDIVNQLHYNRVHVYYSRLPANINTEIPVIDKVVNGRNKDLPPFVSAKGITTVNGANVMTFAKTSQYVNDLYHELVANTLRVSLVVQSWSHGVGNLPSNCSGNYEVRNARVLTLPHNTHFTHNHDHSKFAFSLARLRFQHVEPWVCVGDINRQQSQLHRGGGTVCVYNTALHQIFKATVHSYDPCP